MATATRGGLLRDFELFLVEERVLPQDDLQVVGFLELAHQFSERTLEVLGDRRVDDQ